MIATLIFEIDTTTTSTPSGVDLQKIVSEVFPGKTLASAGTIAVEKLTDTKSLAVVNVTLT